MLEAFQVRWTNGGPHIAQPMALQSSRAAARDLMSSDFVAEGFVGNYEMEDVEPSEVMR